MTLAQAQERYPHVPIEVIVWAVATVRDPKALAKGLARIERSKCEKTQR